MTQENKDKLHQLLHRHRELGISEQIDYKKFYLYSIIAHSTALEGSTVTEVEAQLLFDEGITSSKRTMVEQMMNLDLKEAYEYGIGWVKRHEAITVDWLITLASKVMARTGSEYHALGGNFDSSKGEIRKLNVSAGAGGTSYMNYQNVPTKLAAFCNELNTRRANINPSDVVLIYELSIWAHFELVTIHPWADGNGRTSRLLMNLLQMEYDVLPIKILKEDKAEYIQALIDTRKTDNIDVIVEYMTRLHCEHLQSDIDQFVQSAGEILVDKERLTEEMQRKWSIKPSLAQKMADILCFVADKTTGIKTEMIVAEFGYSETSARRYLRQLATYGYLKAQGGNRNKSYIRNEL